jgi:hypothetical protein
MVIAREGIVGRLLLHPIRSVAVVVAGSFLAYLAGIHGSVHRVAVGLVAAMVMLLAEEALSEHRIPVARVRRLVGLAR